MGTSVQKYKNALIVTVPLSKKLFASECCRYQKDKRAKISLEAALQRCTSEKVFCKYATNLQENTPTKKCDFNKAAK